MRSTLETLSSRYEHAIFTTYSINLHFFEQWVLPLLRKAEVRNVIVLADHRQLGRALDDKAVRAVGRNYHAASMRLGHGAFHPKLMLLAGEAGARLCVSSANLTVDGQLRNLEGAIVLESSVAEHRSAIADAAGFVRRLSEHVPPPCADALLAALAPVEHEDGPSEIRFVHNLDGALMRIFPKGAYTAVTPYVDAGAAARELSAGGLLSILTDGERFAAPPAFFAGDWHVEARTFGHRRLHAKAYWTDTPEGGWLLLGSPNLSAAGLLQTANEANTEVAIVLAPHTPHIADLPGSEWTRADLGEIAPRRHAREDAVGDAHAGAFNAWEDDDGIAVAGVPDGTPVDYWDGSSWEPLGIVLDGRIPAWGDARPYLIRGRVAPNQWRQAIIHRSSQLLRQRLRNRTTSRAADVVTQLPLDLEGIRTLEGVLTDLYVLAELKDRDGNRVKQQHTGGAPGEDSQVTSLTDWMPARPEDEPRVPQIYRQAWQGDPDALLALIRNALRLDRNTEADERTVTEEMLALDELEREPEPAGDGEATAPTVPRPVLTRYRNSLVKLLERGAEFVRKAQNPALADLGFQAVLRLHEMLTQFEVQVDEIRQPLVEPDVLFRHKLALLNAYLVEREGADQQCLATARIHLADCLSRPTLWSPLEWESLQAVAYARSTLILGSSAYVTEAAEDAGVDPATATARLRPYAQRAGWTGFFLEAEAVLDEFDFGDDPFPWVRGAEWFDELASSPAWRCIGYAAIVAFRTMKTYCVVIENLNSASNYAAHAVLVDPKKRTIHETMRRRKDDKWMTRTYKPVDQSSTARIYAIGTESLSDTSRSAFQESAMDVDTDSIVSLISSVKRMDAAQAS